MTNDGSRGRAIPRLPYPPLQSCHPTLLHAEPIGHARAFGGAGDNRILQADSHNFQGLWLNIKNFENDPLLHRIASCVISYGLCDVNHR